MKIFLAALCAFAGIQARAEYEIQKFPGKVKIEVDMTLRSPTALEPLDVLFVMDDSGSMLQYQKILSRSTPIIDQNLSHLNRDFHLGVIGTSMKTFSTRGPQPGTLYGSPKIITSKDMPGALDKNLQVGNQGSGVEAPFDAIAMALSEPLLSGANAGFLRPDSALVIVLVTDAEDQSKLESSELISSLEKLKGDLSKVTILSWVVPSTNTTPKCQRDNPPTAPQKIEEVTKRLNGTLYDLCDMSDVTLADFAQKLAQFGSSLPPTPPKADISEIPLTIEPQVSTIDVRYGTQVLIGGDLSKGWIYDAAKNAVVLGQDIEWSYQPARTKLEVSFVPADWTK